MTEIYLEFEYFGGLFMQVFFCLFLNVHVCLLAHLSVCLCVCAWVSEGQ